MSEHQHFDCLEFGSSACDGEVSYWETSSPTGRAFLRCEAHGARMIERDQERRSNYPDSPIAPAWFDASYAGERWDGDY